ncbi:MAG TPA: Na+/H+ antiporter NhaC [Bacillota bacterium]|nr:Na+/H+ antiporter NhaC [Bacillota bacterium]
MKRELTPMLALIPILALIISAALAVFVWDSGMHVPLLIGTIAAAGVAIGKGWHWKDVEVMMVQGVSRALPAAFILMIIGTIIGTWIASGVIPTIIYYGLSIINPSLFVPIVALVTGIVSITLGSSFTSMATIGIAFMAIGNGLGFSPGLVAGAIISGAFFGDKLSPVSDTTNVAPAMAETDLFSHIKHMLWDTIPAFLLSIALYWIVSNSSQMTSQIDASVIKEIQTGLGDLFLIHPLLLIMPVLTIILMAMRAPAIPTLVGISFLGALIAVIVQGMAVSDVTQVITDGFNSTSGLENVDKLLNRGGLLSMLGTVALLMIATALGGILEETGAFAVLTRNMLERVKAAGSLISTTIFATFVVAFASGSQFLAIILPARTFVHKYKTMGIDTKSLSRCVEAAGTVGINLVPWSVPAIFAASIFSLSPGQFIPYAFFVILVPLINILFGFTGWTISKRTYTETEIKETTPLQGDKAV